MPKISLAEITDYCNRLLRTERFNDWPGAINGLQAANRGFVCRIAAAVDATLATAEMAVEEGADLLIVHHGLFWGPVQPWTGKRHQLLQLLIENNLAVYSSHLPLDAHPALGNNAQVCAALGFKKVKPFFFQKEQFIGLQTRQAISRDRLAIQLENVLGRPPLLLPGGKNSCRRIGVVTGGAGTELATAAREGVDTFITGEGPHWSHALAEDLGLNVFLGGHYATETFGVKALAAHLSRKYGLPWTFLDHPSGL